MTCLFNQLDRIPTLIWTFVLAFTCGLSIGYDMAKLFGNRK